MDSDRCAGIFSEDGSRLAFMDLLWLKAVRVALRFPGLCQEFAGQVFPSAINSYGDNYRDGSLKKWLSLG